MIDKSTRITLQHASIFLAAIIVGGLAMAEVWVPGIRVPVFTNMVNGSAWAAYTHIFPGVASLVLGGYLLSRRSRRSHQLWLHKRLGYAYVVCVMISSVGAVVSNFVSPSPLSAKMAFYTLNLLWPIVTLLATPFDDVFDRQAHGRMMKISYALTFSAVTLRVYLASMLAMGVEFETAYPIAAWGSFVGNLIVLFLTLSIGNWLRKRELEKLTQSLG